MTAPDRTVAGALDVLREALETAHHDGFCVWCASALFEGKREHAPSCLHETGQDALAAVRAEIERLREALDSSDCLLSIAGRNAEAAEARVRELRCELEEMKERTQLARDGKETAE